MQPFNKSQLVKFVYAYVDLFRKVFPFFFLFLLIPIFNAVVLPKTQPVKSYDFFDLFERYQFSAITPSVFWVILIVVLNLIVGIGIFLALGRLSIFMKNVFNDNPFCTANGYSLKYIGIITISLTALIHIIKAFSIVSADLGIVPEYNSILFVLTGILSVVFNPYLILGMFVFLLGEIMMHAAEMKQESDLTV